MLLDLMDRLVQTDDADSIPSIIEAIKQQCGTALPSKQLAAVEAGPDGCYALSYFISRIAAMRKGHAYGYRNAYLEASANSQHPATDALLKQWCMTGRVPREYVEQIDLLMFNGERHTIHRPPWTPIEVEFLVTLIKSDRGAGNDYLAALCSTQFERTVTENAIKGVLYRLHKRGVLTEFGND